MSVVREHHWAKKKAAREAAWAAKAREYRALADEFAKMADEPGLMGKVARIEAAMHRNWAKAYDIR